MGMLYGSDRLPELNGEACQAIQTRHNSQATLQAPCRNDTLNSRHTVGCGCRVQNAAAGEEAAPGFMAG